MYFVYRFSIYLFIFGLSFLVWKGYDTIKMRRTPPSSKPEEGTKLKQQRFLSFIVILVIFSVIFLVLWPSGGYLIVSLIISIAQFIFAVIYSLFFGYGDWK
jgi:Na+/H+ antiporter NhaC